MCCTQIDQEPSFGVKAMVVGSLGTNHDRYDDGDHPNIVASNEITFSAGGGVTTTG